MPDRVPARIAAAFAAIGLVAALAVSAGLFVSLRGLHRDATLAAMGDVAQPVATRIRLLGAVTSLRQELADLAPTFREDLGVYAVTGRRVVTIQEGPQPVDVSAVALDADQAAGEARGRELVADDGTRMLASVTAIKPVTSGANPIALVLVTADRSGALAVRDLLRVLPLLLVAILAVGLPIAWALSRSITRPLRRLLDATAALPDAVPSPVPADGPREVRDLTERFNATTAELERVREEERELLANVRHDLRTPLTVVSGFAEALRDGTATGSAVVRAGDAIAAESARMERLVDDLRSIDELRAGRVGLRPESLDPAGLAADAAARFAPQAAAAGVTLGAASDPDLALVADRAAVERILGNLVTNALAAVPPGGRVVVEARRGATDGMVAIRVSDDGPGFPAGGLERVFDRFYRGDPSRTGAGSGLGLAIVRVLATAHGGTAVAENLAPTGARVTVTLPATPRG
jgi:two-component system sensor histidine kinase BaeS